MARIVGKQRKLDFNKNNKLDKQDFKILATVSYTHLTLPTKRIV